ncbi:restriction modification system DNA specificity domain protein [Dehalogenimonas lykanthroporepellens BL-DC-9]|nr:restriction modification system DNA specificity domain protein [Dehalogenimonas lykanthroporepellens BL-DC-9]
MKNGWQVKALGDICQVIGGGTPSKSIAEYYVGNIPWATVRDMRTDLITETEHKITHVAVKNSATKIISNGNVVIATRVGLGKVCLLGQDTAINQDLRGIVPKDSNILFVRYLFWWLKSVVDTIVAEGTGATVQGVKLPFIKSLQIPLPPLPEQQRIVTILDEAFEGIATAKAKAEKNLQNARALFESHLNSVFSRRGEGWVERRLSDICVFINGRAYKKNEMLSAGKYPLLRVGNFFTNNDWYYTDLDLEPAKYCDTGDLLYAWSASFGPRIWEGGKVVYHYHIWKVIPNINLTNKRFLLYLLSWDVEQIKQLHGTGTTMMHVSKGSIEKRIVPVPPLEQQKYIVNNLDKLKTETQHLQSIYQKKLAALEELKKSLLHQAFSGEL